MYSYISSIRNGLQSSSLISLLARNYGCKLIASRSLSSIPPSFENSEDKLTSARTDQNSVLDLVAILTQQRSKSRWTHLRSLRPDGFSTEEFSQITIRIRNNPHLALRFYLWTQKKSLCKHDLSSYSTIIHVLARGRMRRQALILISEAIRVSRSDDLGLNSNPLKVFEMLVKTYTRCGSAPFVFDLLIEACLESKKIESAIQIVRMLLSRGISPSYGTCNSLLRQVSRSLGAHKGYDLYKEVFGLKSSRVQPSVEIFNTLMMGFYQEGIFCRVREIWDEMIELDYHPNCFSFSTLMATYCDEGDMDKAEYFWEQMRAMSVAFDVLAYNTIIGGFCRIGQIEKAEEFFKEMGLSGLESSPTTCEHLIKGHCKTGNVTSALLVYRDMVSRGFRAEVLTVDELIRGLCCGSMILEAMEVLRCAMKNSGYCLTRESFEVLIKGLCREGNMEEALKLQAKMMCEGYKPTREIYCAFVSGFERQGNTEMTSKLRNEMSEIGLCK